MLVLGLDTFACTDARIGVLFPDDSDKIWRSKGLRYKLSVSGRAMSDLNEFVGPKEDLIKGINCSVSYLLGKTVQL
jgi:hypothetical protein